MQPTKIFIKLKNMTQNEKELLLKDICARLTYSVKAKYYGAEEERECIDVIEGIYPFDNEIIIGQYGLKVEAIKPYLFPLSSVTEEQVNELFSIFELNETLEDDYIKVNEVTGITFLLRNGFDVEEHLEKLMDWLNKYHFDYRGLIPMGLAIDATGLSIYE